MSWEDHEQWKAYLREEIKRALSQIGCEDVYDDYMHFIDPYAYYNTPEKLLPSGLFLLLEPLNSVLRYFHSYYAPWAYPSNPSAQYEASHLQQEEVRGTLKRITRQARLVQQCEILHLTSEACDACRLIRETLSLIRDVLPQFARLLGRVADAWNEEEKEEYNPLSL